MTVRRLLHIGLNVEDLDLAQEFYIQALGFTPVGETRDDPVLTRVLGVRRVHSSVLALGEQRIELTVCDPPGQPYPDDTHDADTWFQDFAITTPDIAAALERLRRFCHTAITQDGPQQLPATSDPGLGYRFRDPDGHPLELVQFVGKSTSAGIDHSAISVTDIELSVSFYQHLGLSQASRRLSSGAEQDWLDGPQGASIDVVKMCLPDDHASPYVALLAHRGSPGRAMITDLPDIAATRMTFTGDTSDGEATALFDPDGHAVLITPDPLYKT